MANTGFKGINVRQTGAELIFDAFLQNSAGGLVTTGTTSLYIWELQSDGTIKTYDFNTNAFSAGAVTTETQAMTVRPSNNATTATGYWTYALSTLTGFTIGAIYLFRVNNAAAVPNDQLRKFQYGGAEGDLLVTAGSTGQATIQGNTVQWAGTSTGAYYGPFKTGVAAGFTIAMVSSTDHVTPYTGGSVTVVRAVNGGNEATAGGSVTQIQSTNRYYFAGTSGDMTGASLEFTFTATGADPVTVSINTTP